MKTQDSYLSTSYFSLSSKPSRLNKITKSVKNMNLKTN